MARVGIGCGRRERATIERLQAAVAESTVRDVGKQIGQGLEEAGRRIQESMQK